MSEPDRKLYYRYNSGLFADAFRSPAGDPPELVGTEIAIAEEIASRLNVEDEVTVVDLGGMIGASMVAIATHFQEAIEQKRLRIIVTNKEPGNTPRWLLEESSIRSKIPDPEILEFVNKNKNLVTFLAGVDTLKLPDKLGEIGINGIDIVHEHFGGLFHHPQPEEAIGILAQALKPNGLIVTAEALDDNSMNKYGKAVENKGIIPERQHKFGQQTYCRFKKPR